MEKLKVSKVGNVYVKSNILPNGLRPGTLYLTPTHIIFTETHGSREKWIPLQHIANVFCLPPERRRYPLQLESKTFLFVTFIFTSSSERQVVFDSFQALLSSVGDEELYCLRFKSMDAISQPDGWNKLDVAAEYRRMGITDASTYWHMSSMNRGHQVCESYPELVCVPLSAKMHILQASASFRYKRRFPVVTYYNMTSNAVICRSALPDEDYSARCIEDEKLVQLLAQTNTTKQLLILDIRGSNERSHFATASYASEANINIESIVMPDLNELKTSLNNLTSGILRADVPVTQYLNKVMESGWLTNVHQLLQTSKSVAQQVQRGDNVLVQCATGVDHTALICSLAQIFLDPFYRSLDGFQLLVEKEWIAFSHPFPWRCRYLPGYAEDHAGPIFTLFLDAVWQIWREIPTAFEFNEYFLVTLHDHSQGSPFGTFTCNSSIQRKRLRLSQRSYSLWGFIKHHRTFFINPFYRPESHRLCIRPTLSTKQMQVWNGLYNRWESSVHPRNSMSDALIAMVDQTCMWNHQSSMLQNYIQQLSFAMKIPSEKILRKVLAQAGNLTGHSSDCSSVDSFSYSGVVSSVAGSCIGEQNDTYTYHPSGSSIESGLGGSVDSPPSEFCSPPPRASYHESSTSQNGTSWISYNMDHHTPTFTGFNMNSLHVKPMSLAIAIDKTIEDTTNTTTIWMSFRHAKVCSGCHQEMNNCIPKRHCWKCGRIQCQRCLRPHFNPPGYLMFTTNHDSLVGKLRVCLTCEKHLIAQRISK